jgi:hypothetical protein
MARQTYSAWTGTLPRGDGLTGRRQVVAGSDKRHAPCATSTAAATRPDPPDSKEYPIMKILVVLTSHDTLGDTGKKTGFWLEELAAPYYAFKDAGVDLTLASPKGGQPPLDPKSSDPSAQTDATRRFDADPPPRPNWRPRAS